MTSYGPKPNRALRVLLAIASLACSASANAILLQIDSATSQVNYTPATGFSPCEYSPSGVILCPDPPVTQTAALSGKINLDIVHEHWEFLTYVTDRDVIWLTTIAFSAGVWPAEFPLTETIGILVGEQFQVTDDPCFLAPFPAICSSTVMTTVHSGANGTWDGHSLTWTGYWYESFGDSLSYTINAEALPVSEPGTLALIALLLPAMEIRRRMMANQ